MNKGLKISKPKFVDDFEDIEDFYDEIVLSDKIMNKIVDSEIIEGKEEKGMNIDSCIFRNVVFNNCIFKNIDIIDTVFENCDLSNIDFGNGSIERVEFINCKLLGAKFDECMMKDVLLKDCLGKYSNFSFSKLNKVHINRCNFEEGVFQEVSINKIMFDNTNLLNGVFYNTSLKNVDLTTCEIAGISVGLKDIKGAKVTAIQGLELTRLLEIIIE
ncbi:pentapeptide repeat-containing protein [Clostridium butyricum]|uniref:pentapeptide repeat-containing protein n=1 Tax=Clostridium butyricum TaxID=1492 RepID=UPI0002CC71FB|nr:pentapeptide repeat-containing protein [Clostridium butyricum]EMU54580.1 pentapeptide repeat protein [Clostridium butyricum DKU-01]